MTHDDVTDIAALKGKLILIAGSSRITFWPWLRAKYGFTDDQIRPYTFNLQPFFADKNVAQQGYPSSEPYQALEQNEKVKFFLLADEALMALYSGYGEGMTLHGADALVVNISQTPGVVILEYEVQGNAVGSGKRYENRFISVVTIKDRKIVGWRDYMDSLAAMSSLT